MTLPTAKPVSGFDDQGSVMVCAQRPTEGGPSIATGTALPPTRRAVTLGATTAASTVHATTIAPNQRRSMASTISLSNWRGQRPVRAIRRRSSALGVIFADSSRVQPSATVIPACEQMSVAASTLDAIASP